MCHRYVDFKLVLPTVSSSPCSRAAWPVWVSLTRRYFLPGSCCWRARNPGWDYTRDSLYGGNRDGGWWLSRKKGICQSEQRATFLSAISGWVGPLLVRWQDLRGTGDKCFQNVRPKAESLPALAKMPVPQGGTEIAEGELWRPQRLGWKVLGGNLDWLMIGRNCPLHFPWSAGERRWYVYMNSLENVEWLNTWNTLIRITLSQWYYSSEYQAYRHVYATKIKLLLVTYLKQNSLFFLQCKKPTIIL